MKKRFPVKWFIWSCVAVTVFSIIGLAINMIRTGFSSEYYIFADISECDDLLLAEDDKTVITQLSPEQDKKLKDNEYVAFRGADYFSPELHFKIFAYEFADADGAKEYFSNVTGKDRVFDTTFSMSSGMFGILRLIVIDGNNAYCIHSTAKDYKELNALLKAHFSVLV